VAAIALVDIGTLDCATGELLGGVDDAAERISVEGFPRSALACSTNLGMQHELAARRAGIGADDGCLNADLWTTPALQEEATNG
jgi:hypothetical protein